jgi:hypothetical protein
MATKKAPATIETNGKGRIHLDTMEATPTPADTKPIILPRLDIRTIQIRLVSDSPLICHAWSEKAIKQMLDKQTNRASAGKEAKDPAADFRSSLYIMERREPFESSTFGFPAIAFKNAAVTACTSLGKSVSKVAARQAFHVVGELVPIEGHPVMRQDMVRVGMGTADIRFRGEFSEWAVAITVRYNHRLLSDEQIVNLFNTAGFAVGVGEWRPERDGAHGMFHVE